MNRSRRLTEADIERLVEQHQAEWAATCERVPGQPVWAWGDGPTEAAAGCAVCERWERIDWGSCFCGGPVELWRSEALGEFRVLCSACGAETQSGNV